MTVMNEICNAHLLYVRILLLRSMMFIRVLFSCVLFLCVVGEYGVLCLPQNE